MHVVLRETKWTKLEKMYSQRLLVFVFKCYNGYHPESLQALFTKYVSQYNLRRKMTVLLPKPRTDYLKKSLAFQGAKLWNSLNNDTRGETNFRIFKNLIQTLN